MTNDSHPSRERLLLHVEGELAAPGEQQVRTHLETCAQCRAVCQEIREAIADVLSVHRSAVAPAPSAAERALLRSRLAQLSASGPAARTWWALPGFAWAGIACGLLILGLLLAPRNRSPREAAIVSIPDPALTPGATLPVSRLAVCAQPNPNNKIVPVALQRQVFQEYGIAGADPRAYEVDYLVTPALGGADDIRNLWPHSYSATVWNARVKDALEDRLHQMVCGGSLDLTQAQQEIAANWIAAYKKYFHTEQPLADH